MKKHEKFQPHKFSRDVKAAFEELEIRRHGTYIAAPRSSRNTKRNVPAVPEASE